jgi:uncharacterized membrane protein
MYDRSDLVTLPYPNVARDETRFDIPVAPEATEIDAPAVDCTYLSTTLPVAAERAYELFCDIDRLPEWMSVVRSARVINRYADGRARRTAFIGELERASVGYTLDYSYDDVALVVSWTTARDATTRISGSARFDDLGPRSCMLHYELDLQAHASLPAWDDPMFDGHPSSAVLADFRDYLSRKRR